MTAAPITGDAAPEAITPAHWPVLAVVSLGGAIGALGRYGVDVLLPREDRGFPVGTFLVNVAGCLLVGAVAGLVYRPGAPRLARPFLMVGVLGGFTTFSTYAVDVVSLGLDERLGTAVGYLLATVLAALLAVEAGLLLSRRWAHRRRQRMRS